MRFWSINCALGPLRPQNRCIARTLLQAGRRRGLLTLAIETSCDDTSVAILETWDRRAPRDVSAIKHETTGTQDNGGGGMGDGRAILHFHEKITANSLEYRGIHPINAMNSHQQNLARLVSKALKNLPTHSASSATTQSDSKNCVKVQGSDQSHCKPDFVSVTRGPGMRPSLQTGLDLAKGLSVAWQVPLLGVHHMQAHALTPRLVAALDAGAHERQEKALSSSGSAMSSEKSTSDRQADLEFPFLTLLISGGHSMLLQSRSLTSHPIIANTVDVAIGNSLDKLARELLPPAMAASAPNTMYAALLEKFAFPDALSPSSPHTFSAYDYEYTPPTTRGAEVTPRPTRFGWSITPPLIGDIRQLKYSFSGISSHVCRLVAERLSHTTPDSEEQLAERVVLARESQRVAFEHLASRVVLALDAAHYAARLGNADKDDATRGLEHVKTLVVSGGVAANRFLRHVLRTFLDGRGYEHVKLVFPPMELCTDNAAMIAWAGTEMYRAGWRSGLDCQSVPVWSMDERAADGGIVGLSGWENVGAS